MNRSEAFLEGIMRDREKFEIAQKKLELLTFRGWKCEVCGKPLTINTAQLAHRLSKTKFNLEKYGEEVIHHPLNLVVTCSDRFGRCNDSVNIGNRPAEVKILIEKIRREL